MPKTRSTDAGHLFQLPPPTGCLDGSQQQEATREATALGQERIEQLQSLLQVLQQALVVRRGQRAVPPEHPRTAGVSALSTSSPAGGEVLQPAIKTSANRHDGTSVEAVPSASYSQVTLAPHQPQRQSQPASTSDPVQVPARTTAVRKRDEGSTLCGVSHPPLSGLQYPAEDKDAGKFCDDEGYGEIYVSLTVPALDASEGVKATPLPDGDLSQAAALPRPQLRLPLHASLSALSVRPEHVYPTESVALHLECHNAHLFQVAPVRRTSAPTPKHSTPLQACEPTLRHRTLPAWLENSPRSPVVRVRSPSEKAP